MEKFDHAAIEEAARQKWESLSIGQVDLETAKDPYYLLVEFPYPSGDLHIGHWYAFAVTDMYARLLRLRGKDVLFPIGFDAFGLPAENAAIKHGADPKQWTYDNIERMRGQLRSMGPSFDWNREVITADPSYYQWTQWLFTKLFEHGLAERKTAPVKWCPKDQTVLANEQIIDGRCERCGTLVVEKILTQWFLKITDYAERLLEGLEKLPWRKEIKEAQRAWIGKSEGAYLYFPVKGYDEKIKVFTTRPDTVFGATYVVLAPEHVLAKELQVHNREEVDAYIAATVQKTERERSENKEKTGVRLEGVTAVNPATNEEIPIFAADYVLGSYGTGAVMAVPAHDERDFEFAQKHNLPLHEVVIPNRIDKRNPPREGKKFVERKNVHVIVRDSEGKILILKWKKHPWTTFPMGGIEEGESLLDAAVREVREETGYKNLKNGKILGGQVRAEYFAAHKDENRVSYSSLVSFDLADEERDEVSVLEASEHDIAWLFPREVTLHTMVHAEMDVWLDRMQKSGPYVGPGWLINSGTFSEKESEEAAWAIVEALGGERTTNYHLRDWLVSRQRYWGCPIPIVYDPQGAPHAVPAEHLPWLLPTDVDFKPTGEASPLASSSELKERVTRMFGEGWTPEYDTLDTFVDSSWYFTRYFDPKDPHQFSDQAHMKKWLPVNRYSGGSEHTTMHLLYARFFIKALYDLALVPIDEPFIERYNRGLIMGPDGQKMSKSKGNVVNPDEFVATYGADAVRVYLAFIGPYNEPGNYPWNLDGVASMHKFLNRVMALICRRAQPGGVIKAIGGSSRQNTDIRTLLAKTAKKISEDGDRFKFNTAIAALMILLSKFESQSTISQNDARDFIIMLAPFAPHLAEHLWEMLGGEKSVHQQAWPDMDVPEASTIEVVVQINGKRRGMVTLFHDAGENEAAKAARELEAVAAALAGKSPRRTVYVPGKIINFVI